MTNSKHVASSASRVAGLVLAGFKGTSGAEAQLAALKGLAGVVLFKRNLESAAQAAALADDVRSALERDGAPPIVAIDEEGGIVSRIDGFGTGMPSAMALGATRDGETIASTHRAIGKELAALGITLDFAPVADVNTSPLNPVIGIRSFGDDPQRVSDCVRAAIRGLHEAGIGATAKHFPGHGAASVDSHRALPVIERDIEALREVELIPFRAAIEAGVDAVMSAHIALPRIEPSGAPATLSHASLTRILRDELGFTGVACTDCLQMDAIAQRYGAGTAAVMAVKAGADLVTFSSNIASVQEAVAALAAALDDGTLNAAIVERSLERVRALRERYGRRPSRDAAVVGSEEHRRIALDAARKAITLVRDPAAIVPLRLSAGQKMFLVQFSGAAETPASTGRHSTVLGARLERGAARVHEQRRSLDPSGHEYKQLLMAAASADAIVAVTRRAWLHPLQIQAVSDLRLAGKPLVVVAAREPYDATSAPADAAVLATYGDDDATMEALADVLLGAHAAAGSLPVSLEGASAVAGGRGVAPAGGSG